jgi:hypothetical protein
VSILKRSTLKIIAHGPMLIQSAILISGFTRKKYSPEMASAEKMIA